METKNINTKIHYILSFLYQLRTMSYTQIATYLLRQSSTSYCNKLIKSMVADKLIEKQGFYLADSYYFITTHGISKLKKFGILPICQSDNEPFYPDKFLTASCINDICFELSKDLWDSIFSYVITINKPDIESTISCGHSRFFLDKNCTRIEKNNIAKFPFIKDAISLTRLALKETDVSDANEILLSALSKLYHAIEDLDLPVDSSKIKNPAKSNGVSMNITTHKTLCLPSDKLPSWLTLDTILEY